LRLHAGWLDAGIEYIYAKLDVFGSATATGAAGLGYGVANRFMVAAIVRLPSCCEMGGWNVSIGWYVSVKSELLGNQRCGRERCSIGI
jgi:hypothetical protein